MPGESFVVSVFCFALVCNHNRIAHSLPLSHVQQRSISEARVHGEEQRAGEQTVAFMRVRMEVSTGDVTPGTAVQPGVRFEEGLG